MKKAGGRINNYSTGAKNFLLSDELSINRKIKEGLLALKIEQTLPKERILELYLNQIYLGSGTYGIVAASNRYFKKSLSELDIHEMAWRHLRHQADIILKKIMIWHLKEETGCSKECL